jgi:CP family cyanate transporter-like MFS transporter
MNRIPWSRLALLWLAGVDLRLTLLAIPPLIPLIHRDLPLDETAVAALLGLPVLLLAAAATLGSMIISRFDARRTAIFGLALLGASSALRGAGPSLPMLFAMTLVMGASVAIVQPALPALVYHWAPDRVGLATAVYTNGLLIGELMGAGLTTQWVVPMTGSWPLALALWGLIPLVSAPMFWRMSPSLGTVEAAERPRWLPDFHRALTWRLGITQGGGGIIYFGSNAFLPDYLHHAGATHLIAPALLFLSGSQLLASIAVALLSGSVVGRRGPIQAMSLFAAVGLAVFFIPHDWARLAGAAMLGFASAFAFIINLAFPPLLAETPGDVHRISAGMFTIGYGLAFLVPLLGGAAWDRTGIAAVSLIGLGILVAMRFGTTVTAALVAGDATFVAHVGDSRCYLGRGEQIFQISEDHSLVNEQLKAGAITEEEARSSRFRNIITRSVGFEEQVLVDVMGLQVKPGDTLVLCCDGLSNLVDDVEIGRIATSEPLAEAPEKLVALANERGGDDNITVIVVKIDGAP